MSDRGSATVLMLAVTGLLAASAIGATSLGLILGVRTTAATAADAAALAAAVATYPGAGRGSPASEASRAAVANGARLESCSCPVDGSLTSRTVTVRVSAGVTVPLFGALRVWGAARAEFDPMRWLGLLPRP